ncbi:MAG: metal-dependent hydrolase [Candidatus Micrarchaeota archaeon]
MEGKTHLFCAFMYLGAAAFSAFKLGYANVLDSVLFVVAVVISVQLPDVDVTAGKNNLNRIIQIPVMVTKYFLFLPISLLLFFLGKKGAEHRGVMHSLKGLFLVFAFWLVIGVLLLNYFGALNNLRPLSIAVLGLLAGYLFHLWNDALTVSGVQLTDKLKIKGWLKTGKHEWVLQMFFLIISAVAANLANMGNIVYAACALILAFPLSFLLFVR